MNKLNKIVTNYPVELTPEEVENLSLTLSAVHTAKDEGKTYSGEGFVNVNNTNNTISLTTEANEKLNQPIPTKVSDLTDSASYQTTAGMNDYLTKTSASENLAPLSVTADIEALKNTSGDFSLYYEKTETSSKDELSSEFIKYVTTTEFNSVTGDVSTLKSASSEWNKVSDKLDTTAFSTVSGDFVNKNDLNDYATKSDLETASSELLTTAQYKTDSATFLTDQSLENYATKEYANNASANALSEAKTWVGQQGYLSAIPDTYALKTDVPTTVAQLTDSGNYYEKTDTSSKDELNTAFGSKQDNLTQEQFSAISSVSSIKGTILTGDSNIRTTSAEVGNNIKWTLELTAQPVVTDTTLSGYDGIVATKDSTVSSQWNIGIAQAYKEQIEAVSSKLTQEDADALYAPISVTGDVNTLKSSSGDWNKVSDKIDTTAVAQTYQTKSDMTNYLTTSDASTTYQPIGDYATTSDISDMATQTWVGQQGFYTKASGDNDYAPISITTTVNTLTAASAGWNDKVDKPTSSLADKYLVLRTDIEGNVSGWCDFQDQTYSKTEALGTFVATANIDTTTLSGDGKSSGTKLGVKTDVIATRDYVNSSFLPTSGGTVSGELVVSATTGTFDSSYVKCVNDGNDGYSRFGVGSYGGAVIKAVNGNNNTQVNVKYNANNNELIQVQKDGTDIGFLIPAVTATTTAGLTNDGILHIILES